MKSKLIILLSIIITIGAIFAFKYKKQEIVHPTVGPITESVYAISTVKSESNFTLRIGVLSNIDKLYVAEGDEVNPGQKLLTIDGGTSFYSPHSGIVTEIPFGLKETIAPQTPIIKIVDLKNLYLEASIEQVAALKINKGMRVVISLDDYRNKIFEGSVKSVLPREQDFVIQVEVKNLPQNILPGMSADLSIEISKKENAVTIPSKAVSNGFIILNKNGSKIKTKVEVGITDAENVEIISPNLKATDEIILPTKEKF